MGGLVRLDDLQVPRMRPLPLRAQVVGMGLMTPEQMDELVNRAAEAHVRINRVRERLQADLIEVAAAEDAAKWVYRRLTECRDQQQRAGEDR